MALTTFVIIILRSIISQYYAIINLYKVIFLCDLPQIVICFDILVDAL